MIYPCGGIDFDRKICYTIIGDIMDMRSCFLYCAGKYYDGYITPREGDIKVAVDGGFKLCESLGITPDCIIGDFDSLGSVPQNAIVLPREKDDTDTLAACKRYLSAGIKSFFLLGAVGGRDEHTFANIQLLKFLSDRGAQGFMFGNDRTFTVIKDCEVTFGEEYEGYISVFSLSDESCVSIKNLKYGLDNATLSNSYPLGVSNEFMGRSAKIRVMGGTLLLIFDRKGNFTLPYYNI